MATIKTESAVSMNAPDRRDGTLQVAWGHYTYADEGAVAIGDVIQMCKLPAGARIVDIMVEWGALTSGTFDVGDGDNDDRFLAAIAMDNAGRMSLFGGLANGAEIDEATNVSGMGYTYDAADTLDITIEGAAISATLAITLCVLYTVEGGFDDE